MLLRDAALGDSAAIARILVDTWRKSYIEIMPPISWPGCRMKRGKSASGRAF